MVTVTVVLVSCTSDGRQTQAIVRRLPILVIGNFTIQGGQWNKNGLFMDNLSFNAVLFFFEFVVRV